MRVALLLPLVLAGCGPAPEQPATNLQQVAEQAQNLSPPAIVNETAPSPAAAPIPSPTPALAAEPDGAAAADVVRRYYAAIERGDYAAAWRLREPDNGDPASFAAAFSRYAEFHAEVGPPGRIDAGAGQRYVEVPVRIYGSLKQGGPFEAKGTVTLHHAADIPGATADQRRWRIRDSDIAPAR